jgi:hypothetical protein
MVFIHVKRGENNEFLYETTVNQSNDELIRDLCYISNMRLRLSSLADALPSLAKFGVAKAPDNQGIDRYQENFSKQEKSEYYEEDPLGLRTGEGVCEQLKETIEKVAQDAKLYVTNSKTQMELKIPIKKEILEEKLQNMKGAVMMAFPMGLPSYDPIKILLETKNLEEALAESSSVLEVLPEETSELWWAGKQFYRDQQVKELVGTNEKTKIIVKLQKKGNGAPSREPGVSENERKAMMAYYFKKQEELKKITEDDTEEYMNSSWADPRALKNSLRGTNTIRPF